MSLIIGWYLGSALAPFIIVGLILWFFYELVFNFWATMETVFGFVLAAINFLWEMASGLFMCVWDISYIGPLLAIGGTVVVLRLLSIPIFAILKGVFLVGAFFAFVIGDIISRIPKAGMKKEKTEVDGAQVEMVKEDSSLHK